MTDVWSARIRADGISRATVNPGACRNVLSASPTIPHSGSAPAPSSLDPGTAATRSCLRSRQALGGYCSSAGGWTALAAVTSALPSPGPTGRSPPARSAAARGHSWPKPRPALPSWLLPPRKANPAPGRVSCRRSGFFRPTLTHCNVTNSKLTVRLILICHQPRG